jgi:phytoene dehydrogenase-like protein
MSVRIGTSMKKERNGYEVIVLGSGLGGLVAGTFLARKNLSVLFLKEKEYQSSFIKEGYRFTPFSNFSEKYLNPTLLQEVSKALNLPFLSQYREGDRQAKAKQEVFFQVILPKARIDLFYDRSLFQSELKREFPEEVAPIENFYEEINSLQHLLKKVQNKGGSQSLIPLQKHSIFKSLFSFKTLSKGEMSQRLSPFSREFKQFIQLQLISHGNLFSDQWPMALVAFLLNDEPNRTTPHIDLEKCEENMFEHFVQSGGRVEEVEKVEKLDKEWRRGFVLSSERGEGAFQSEFLILNSPLHRALNILSKKRKRLSKWEKRIQARYVLIPFFLGIRERVVPVGMKNLLVSILDLDKPYDDGNVLYLSLSPEGDETKAPEGKRALTAESLMPMEKLNPSFLDEYQGRVMNHLTHLFPFLENNVEFIDHQWANEQVSRWSYPHFIYETTSNFHWRKVVVPNRLSRNLFFVGKENFPYLGLEGEILSGLMVAKQILRKFV